MDSEKDGGYGSQPPSPHPDPVGSARFPGPGGETGLKRALLALLTGTTHVVGLVEADGTVAYAGPSVLVLLGYRPEEVVGRNFAEFVHPDDLGTAASMIAAETSRPGTAGTFTVDADIAGEYRLRHADGTWVPFEILRNNFLAEPDIHGILIVGRPVGARHALDQALGVLAYNPDGSAALVKLVEYLDGRLPGTASAVLIATNPPEWVGGPAVGSLLGGRGPWERSVATGETTCTALGEEGTFDPAVEATARAAGFRVCWSVPLPIRQPQVYSTPLAGVLGVDPPVRPPTPGGEGAEAVSGCLVVWSSGALEPPVGYLGVIERVGGLADLAIKRRLERQRMRHLVDFDHLTGALSRAGLGSMIAGSENVPRARLVIDLDGFKEVNDRYGHTMGDDVLRVVVKRLNSVLRYQDLLARMGGDEFLLLVTGSEAPAGVAVARRIAAVLDTPITVGSVSVGIRVSIGIAPWDPEASHEQLVERADQAMYAAKRGGKNRWSVWGGAGS